MSRNHLQSNLSSATLQKTYTRQELCAVLHISESTLRRRELEGLPFILVGRRTKRYDLEEVKKWLKEVGSCPSGLTRTVVDTSALWSMANAFTEECRKVRLRVMPSDWKQSS